MNMQINYYYWRNESINLASDISVRCTNIPSYIYVFDQLHFYMQIEFAVIVVEVNSFKM